VKQVVVCKACDGHGVWTAPAVKTISGKRLRSVELPCVSCGGQLTLEREIEPKKKDAA
jgi:hypothetical protein